MGEEIQSLKINNSRKKPFSIKFIKTDADLKFYTGIQSMKVFDAIFKLLQPYIEKLQYWRGEKHHVQSHKLMNIVRKKTMKWQTIGSFTLLSVGVV